MWRPCLCVGCICMYFRGRSIVVSGHVFVCTPVTTRAVLFKQTSKCYAQVCMFMNIQTFLCTYLDFIFYANSLGNITHENRLQSKH